MASDLSVSDRSTAKTTSSDESETSTIHTFTLAEPSTAFTVPTIVPFGKHAIEPVKKYHKYNRRKWNGLNASADRNTRIEQEVGHAVGGSELYQPGASPAVLELEDEGQPLDQRMKYFAIIEKFLAGHMKIRLLASTAVIFLSLLLSEKRCTKLLLISSIALLVMLGRVLANNATNHLWVPSYSVTQRCGSDGAFRAQIGLIDQVPRWAAGTVLVYVICAETFPSPTAAALAASNFAQAIALFADIPIIFREVTRNSKADFRVIYKDLPLTGEANVLASAFLPNRGPREARTLHIYGLAFRQEHVGNQVQVLAHEIGHILGLRHEFAPESREPPSLTYGRRNPGSIMSYPVDWSTAQVTQQDIDELKKFYQDSHPHLRNKAREWFVEIITPQQFLYPCEKTNEQVGFMTAFFSTLLFPFRWFRREHTNAIAC